MPRKPKHPPIIGEHFVWHLRQRNGVYYADGRSGRYNLGKHSLNTRDRDEALLRLRRLDLTKAVELGFAEEYENAAVGPITIGDGWKRYLEYSGRSQILGGVAPSTLKRYGNTRNRHLTHCQTRGIDTWNKFDRKALEQFGNWLFKKYAYQTCYCDLTQIKSVVNWLIKEGLLPPQSKLVYPLRKPQGTDTYCYKRAEVTAIIEYCDSRSNLKWLFHVVTALAHSGVRISELIGLRWTDIDLSANVIRIADERTSKKKLKGQAIRTTKGRRSRVIPIHPELRKLLLKLDRKPDGRVFHALRGGALRKNTALKVFKEKVIEPLSEKFPTPEGEIGFRHGTFHGFRHFFCSQCFLGGASEGEIREWMGHRESKIVEHYRHLSNEDAQRKMKKIDFLGSSGKQDCKTGVT